MDLENRKLGSDTVSRFSVLAYIKSAIGRRSYTKSLDLQKPKMAPIIPNPLMISRP